MARLTDRQFLKAQIDLEPLGLIMDGPFEAYFCTPKGARIFARSGVDGIHFCFVRGFGETVFAVSPMNGRENCVHPVAKSFRDFLRLLLALLFGALFFILAVFLTLGVFSIFIAVPCWIIYVLMYLGCAAMVLMDNVFVRMF